MHKPWIAELPKYVPGAAPKIEVDGKLSSNESPWAPPQRVLDAVFDAQTRSTMQELLTHVWETHKITVLFVTHDVDEAVFISDRVLVMTAPRALQDDISIELPRPRDFEMMTCAEFLEYKQRIFREIRQEYARKPVRLREGS